MGFFDGLELRGKTMELAALSKEEYKGKTFLTHYKTKGYLHIDACEDGFRFSYRAFGAEKEKSLKDTFFGDWLENPVAFGAFQDGRMVGFVEGSLETWNRRFRISNLCVFEESHRGHGVGGKLMRQILRTAKDCGARMAVLETQTCNEKAIAFYKKHGFQIIGFDLYAYTNDDPEQNEIRLEMGLILPSP